MPDQLQEQATDRLHSMATKRGVADARDDMHRHVRRAQVAAFTSTHYRYQGGMRQAFCERKKVYIAHRISSGARCDCTQAERHILLGSGIRIVGISS